MFGFTVVFRNYFEFNRTCYNYDTRAVIMTGIYFVLTAGLVKNARNLKLLPY